MVGREKLTNDPLPFRSCSTSRSWTLVKPVTRCAAILLPVGTSARSKLTPRPDPLVGGGDVMRPGGSRLAVRRCVFDVGGGGRTGSAGTGGASSTLPRTEPRLGELGLNVLSDMEPLLLCLCSPRPPGPMTLPAPLPSDVAEFWRRMVRFVCTLATDVGDVV